MVRPMHIHEIMTRRPRVIMSDDSLLIARDLMLWTGIAHLPVLDGGNLVGVLTDRELAAWIWKHPDRARGLHLEPASAAMKSSVHTCAPGDQVAEVAGRMASFHLSCMPVVERGDLVGLVTTTDMLAARALEAQAPEGGPTAADVMTRDPSTAHPDDYLLDAAAHMQEQGIRHLPVVDGGGKVIGIISDRDVRSAVGDPARALGGDHPLSVDLLRVKDAMTEPAITTTGERSCREVGKLFADWALGAVPVVDDAGRLLGIVSYIDVLRALTRS
jgi:acetoin utilization protein AcuB